jgi:DNA-binding NarL/FixJ family response regulator
VGLFTVKKNAHPIRKTYGQYPKHLEVSLKEIRDEIERLMDMTGSVRILIVEDNTLFRQSFKETLQDRFPSVEFYEAIDGEEALLQVEALRPNLIFMDIRLPGENGLQLTQKIKARYPKIIVIILTGYDLPEYREALSRYTDYFFSKDSTTTENIFTLIESIFPSRL